MAPRPCMMGIKIKSVIFYILQVVIFILIYISLASAVIIMMIIIIIIKDQTVQPNFIAVSSLALLAFPPTAGKTKPPQIKIILPLTNIKI